MTNTLREGLPDLPPLMRDLPIDARGYPVPKFVHVNEDGTPDHRVAEATYMARAVRDRLCWVCGKHMENGLYCFLVGPVSLFTRVSPEPPMHAQCAAYAARSCPFLTKPRAHRRSADLPEGLRAPPGEFLQGNPHVVLQWFARSFSVEVYHLGNGKHAPLFLLHEPLALLWFTEGRPATPPEVERAVSEATDKLDAMARAEGPAGVQEMTSKVQVALATLERLAPSP